MTKEQMLELLMLLSALESWGFSMQQPLPDYLAARVANASVVLRNEVLK